MAADNVVMPGNTMLMIHNLSHWLVGATEVVRSVFAALRFGGPGYFDAHLKSKGAPEPARNAPTPSEDPRIENIF
jgi:hypothetical protein